MFTGGMCLTSTTDPVLQTKNASTVSIYIHVHAIIVVVVSVTLVGIKQENLKPKL